jgi:hypothetical protein
VPEPDESSGGRPVAFMWRGRLYLVTRLLAHRRESRSSPDPGHATDEECYRVEAEGEAYDFRLDRHAGRGRPEQGQSLRWRLARVPPKSPWLDK